MTKLHLAHFTLIRFLVRVNAHVGFQRIRITKTLLAHIALVLPSLSLHSFRSGNNKSLWHVMMILLHHDIFIVFTGTATEHPQQPKLFVSLFFFSSSPLLFLITYQTVFTFTARLGCGFFLRPPIIVAFILSSLLLLLLVLVLVVWSVANQSESPLFLLGPSLHVFFFKCHTLNNRKTKSFPLQHVVNFLVTFASFYCAIHSRAFVASNNGRCLRFKPLVAEKERRSFRFLTTAFSYIHIYILYINRGKTRKSKRSLNRRRFGRLIS